MRIMAGRGRRPDENTTAQGQPGSEADELTAELGAFYWQAHDRRLAETGFAAVARQLPGLIRHAIRLGWEANRRDTVATIGLNVISGVLTGFALLATTGVLEALFAAGPTPQRVRAAPRQDPHRGSSFRPATADGAPRRAPSMGARPERRRTN